MTKIVADVLAKNNLPGAIASTVTGGGSTVGEWIIQDPRFKLISFTGSSQVRGLRA